MFADQRRGDQRITRARLNGLCVGHQTSLSVGGFFASGFFRTSGAFFCGGAGAAVFDGAASVFFGAPSVFFGAGSDFFTGGGGIVLVGAAFGGVFAGAGLFAGGFGAVL